MSLSVFPTGQLIWTLDMAWDVVTAAQGQKTSKKDRNTTVEEREERLRCLDCEISRLQILRELEYQALRAQKERICFIGRIPNEVLTVCTFLCNACS